MNIYILHTMKVAFLALLLIPVSLFSQNKMTLTLLETNFQGTIHSFPKGRIFEISQKAGEQHDTVSVDTFDNKPFLFVVHQQKFTTPEKTFYGYIIQCLNGFIHCIWKTSRTGLKHNYFPL